MRISDWSSDVCSSDLMSRKAAGYLLSGGGAAVIDISLFRLCAPVMGVTAGATPSFLVAAVAHFLVSSRYVFGGGGGARKAGLFLVFAGVGLVLHEIGRAPCRVKVGHVV